jgi:hypothetical protein
MADTVAPYIPHQPGDLITAEDWNDMQRDVKNDIATQTAAAIAKVKDVDHATNSDKVGGLSIDDLTKSILDKVYQQLPKRTGYMQVFLNLSTTAVPPDKLVHHGLKAYPVTDIYQLDYFQAVCAKSERSEDQMVEWLLFYLYHSEERRLRIPPSQVSIDIETDPKFRVPFMTLVDQFKEQKLLDYTDDTTLDELEVAFWHAMFRSPPNDSFDPDTYCHSPWFEKCCGEKRSVGDLRKRGDLPQIYLKVKPQKTDNAFTKDGNNPVQFGTLQEPTNVLVSQLDPDTVALRLLAPPIYNPAMFIPPTQSTGVPAQSLPPTLVLSQTAKNFLPVMVLLKV